MKFSPSFSLRYFFLVLCGLLLIGLLAWKTTEEMAVVAPPVSVIPAPAPASVSNDQKASRSPVAEISRPLEIEVPIAGNLQGVDWINFSYSNPDGTKVPPIDVLVNEQGMALMARYGDEAYATRPNQQAYQDLLPIYFFGFEVEKSPFGQVRHAPVTVDDPAFGEAIRGTFHTSPETKLRTWIPLEFDYESDQDGPQVRRGVLRISTVGHIGERELQVPYGAFFTADSNLYAPPVVAGANRFGALVLLQFEDFQFLGGSAQKLPHSGRSVYIHESWAGGAPWQDEQLDPVYGEYRIDELTIPSDRFVRVDNNLYGVQAAEKGPVFKPRPDAEARRAARLAQEAAEKSASGK